jgi:hypothetical protein
MLAGCDYTSTALAPRAVVGLVGDQRGGILYWERGVVAAVDAACALLAEGRDV